jgi:hypothetical protein
MKPYLVRSIAVLGDPICTYDYARRRHNPET